jgi:hypothetical protein
MSPASTNREWLLVRFRNSSATYRGIKSPCLRHDVAEPLVDHVPGDDVPPGAEVVRAAVPVLQIVGVLPDIAAEEPRCPVHQHAVLVGQRHDLEAVPRGVHDQKRPSRAEVFCGRVGKERLKLFERAEVPLDGVSDRALRRSVRARSKDVPEELMVHVASAVVSDHCPDRLRDLVEAMQQVLDRELGERRIRLECLVQVVDVGFVMPVVMEFHRLRVDVRLERVVAESQRR